MRADLTRRASKFLRTAPSDVAIRVWERIHELEANPHPSDAVQVAAEMYSGHEVHRVRVGKYRVKYSLIVSLRQLVILDIDKRSRVYK